MTIDETVRRTLGELGVTDAAGVETLFAEVRAAIEAERAALVSRGAASESERDKLCKDLRDRWIARKNGILSSIDEKWLKTASKDLKPSVGRSFNALRHESAALEIAALTKDVPLRAQAPRDIKVSVSDSFSLNDSVSATLSHVTREVPSDLTLPGNRRPLGSLHPVTQMQREIEEIFLNLGFRIESGPEIESVYYNFDALNIPESHPSARRLGHALHRLENRIAHAHLARANPLDGKIRRAACTSSFPESVIATTIPMPATRPCSIRSKAWPSRAISPLPT